MLLRYQESSEFPTGKCAVLITGKERSLVTNLEAANHFTVSHLESPENWAVVSCTVISEKKFPEGWGEFLTTINICKPDLFPNILECPKVKWSGYIDISREQDRKWNGLP